jgi:tRNA dimethylallyltransferase
LGDADVRVITGPTAAGKSAVALWLAERFHCTIISADSRQVYRGFDIGTAKPSREDRSRVPHLGIDVADPTTRYSAAAWAEGADEWIRNTEERGRIPLVVGGTGLYLRALFDGFFEEPELDRERRSQLSEVLESMETSELARWVRTLDPKRAHLGRTQLLRAIEIALLTGSRISELHDARRRHAGWRARYLVVDPGPVLGEQIATRIDAMIRVGWLDEVRRLAASVPHDAPAWKASGYRAMRDVVEGTMELERGKELVLYETRQYAKRQRTWFRHQLPRGRVTELGPRSVDWQEWATRWFEGREVDESRR